MRFRLHGKAPSAGRLPSTPTSAGGKGPDALDSSDDLRAPPAVGAAWAAGDERYELPRSAEELELLRLVAEGRYPQRVGRLVGLYSDVVEGRATRSEAERAASAITNPTELPIAYCKAVSTVASRLAAMHGRAADGLLLARLLLAAADAVHGRASREWDLAASAFAQCASTVIKAGERVPDASGVADQLVSTARASGDRNEIARTLSIRGQLDGALAGETRDETERVRLLKQARDALAEAAELRDGSERGRSLATLTQIVDLLRHAGAASDDDVREIAQAAIALVDRSERPVQWFAVRRHLESAADGTGDAGSGAAQTLRKIALEHGPHLAAKCLAQEMKLLLEHGQLGGAADLLATLWDEFAILELSDQVVRGDILGVAVHVLDGGCVHCRPYSAPETRAAAIRIDALGLQPLVRAAALAHLVTHADPAEPALGLLSEAHSLAEPSSLQRAVVSFASGLVHARTSGSPDVAHAFAFRCALLSARSFLAVNQERLGKSALAQALVVARRFADWIAGGDESAPLDRRLLELRAVLDACLREASWLDARLGDVGREWLHATGRALSASILETGHPALWLAHRLAFRGAFSSSILRDPRPTREPGGLAQLRLEVAALEDLGEDAPTTEFSGDRRLAETRLCSWLHGAERRGGSSRSARRLNIETRYDELLMQQLLAGRSFSDADPWRLVSLERLQAALAPRSALVDTYLGRDASGGYTCTATLVTPRQWSLYVIRQRLEEQEVLVDPEEPDSHLLLDGVAQLVASTRARLQEPSGVRPLSRAAAAALATAAGNVFGRLDEDLDSLRAEGCRHLVICPHGPLAYLPFAALPMNGVPLADDWTVTTIPTPATLIAPRVPASSRQPVWLGVAASPKGGLAAGLPAEPSLWSQAEELAAIRASTELTAHAGATPEAVCRLLERSRFAHIAAHGNATGHAPAFHCLYLDPGENGEGRLFAHDILRADLRGVELVSLCACETALGRTDLAGNWRGLPFAFLAAGAESVVATLWPVEADPAQLFFANLYRELAAGASRLSAFASAQRETREAYPRYRQWAAFTYIGSWSPT